MSEQCEVPGCDRDVDNFPEPFPVPEEIGEDIPTPDEDAPTGLVMCDWHHVAARILAYTRPDHPYVDVGLYQEVTYYSRSLSAETFDIPAQEKVNQPSESEE